MGAVDRLVVKLAAQDEIVALARIWIPPYPRERNGKIEQVDGYWRDIGSLEDLAKLPVQAIQAMQKNPNQIKIKGAPFAKQQFAGNIGRLTDALDTAKAIAAKEWHDTGFRQDQNEKRWTEQNLARIMADLLKNWAPRKVKKARLQAGKGAGIGALHG